MAKLLSFLAHYFHARQFIVLLLLSKEVVASSVIGHYQTVNELDCKINLTIHQQQHAMMYTLSTPLQTLTGALEINSGEGVDHTYISFKGVRNTAGNNDLELVVTEESIVFQNTGNAMNPFTYFPECSGKFIRLHRQ